LYHPARNNGIEENHPRIMPQLPVRINLGLEN
jgi:hypothetical protein